MANIDGLIEFSRLPDRDRARFFVGRERELDSMERHCRRAWESKDGVLGGAMLIQGCPGMGKTSLLNHFVDRIRRRDDEGGKKPLVVTAACENLFGMQAFVEHCTRAGIRQRNMDRVWRWLLHAAAGIPNAKNAVEATSRDVEEWLLEGRRMALFVDEVQNSSDKNAEVYRKLHQGLSEMNVAVVFAGLSDSRAVLSRLGLSHMGDENALDLGLLDEQDCREAMALMLDAHDVQAVGREPWLRFVVDASGLFPQHLHSALKASARAIAEDGGRFTGRGLERAGAEARQRRFAYYRQRCEGLVLWQRRVAARLMRIMDNDGVADDETLSILMRQEKASETDSRKLRDEFVHRGLLQERYQLGTYEVPIPSFQTWIIDESGFLERRDRTAWGLGEAD